MSARRIPSLAATAHDSRAAHRRSRPNISSLVAPGQRHSLPEAAAKAVARAADGGHAFHSPSLAKPASRSLRAMSSMKPEPTEPEPAEAGLSEPGPAEAE